MFHNRAIWLSLFLMMLGLAACRDNSVEPVTRIEGDWGGDHITLSADRSGGTLEYDCAHGTIAGPLIIAPNGHFRLVGNHTRESGGPIHQGDPPDIHPASYEGRLSGGILTLTITLEDTGDVLGPYMLVRGKDGRIYKCL